MNTIEHHLSTLKPAGQAELARRILAVPAQRRQRRRDCIFGFGGLLTGIAATLLVVMWVPRETIEVPVVVFHTEAQRHEEESVIALRSIPAFVEDTNNSRNGAQRNDGNSDPIDLDAWIARYEKLLRHRHDIASRFAAITPKTPLVLPDGMSPLEYRNRLMNVCLN